MKELEGITVKSIEINADKDVIRFNTTDGKQFYASAVGDCCSTSWFEHVNGVDVLFGRKVNRVVEREMPEESAVDGETVRYYGWTLETDAGRCDFEMRNRSNGYYGGNVNVAEGRALNQYNDETEIPKMKQLTDDF